MTGCNKNNELCCSGLLETDDESGEYKMENGYADAMEGRGESLDEVFDNLGKLPISS